MKTLFKTLGFMVLVLVTANCNKQSFSIPSQKETYQQNPVFNDKVDILIMSDDSSSMSKYQAGVASQVSSMISSLDAMGMDYHIAVTTSSLGGKFKGGTFIGSPKFLSRNSPNLLGVLSDRIQVGQGGSDVEQGLMSVKNALSPENLSGENSSFLRDDAFLAVIFLSNENDYSALKSSDYISFFNTLKKPFPSGARSWVANFVGITSLAGACSTVGEYIEVGTRYIEVADASEGIKESICDGNWSRVMTNVQVRINQLVTDYYITRKPKVPSIQVWVSGQVILQDAVNGWTYEEKVVNGVQKYFIRFHGKSIPKIHDSIDVKSDPASAT